MALAEIGIDPRLDSMLWEVFSKLDDAGVLLAGLERTGTAQRGSAGSAMRHPLLPGISAR